MKHTKRKTKPVSWLKAIRRKWQRRRYHVYNVTPRHLARSVAKANMQREGMKHINSMFAWTWRRYVKVR